MKRFGPALLNYDRKRTFIAPTIDQMSELGPFLDHLKVSEAVDPKHPVDNRVAVRYVLWKFSQGSISDELFNRLSESYDNGYYKKCDGKSTPFRWWAIAKDQELVGIKKDIVSVRHDLDYYRGRPNRLEADLFYLLSQHCVGSNKLLSTLEYGVLRVMGWAAWKGHREQHQRNPKYGTDAYIRELPNVR